MSLTDAEIEQFVGDGAVPLRQAFPRDVADDCRAILWRATGCDEHDRSTWTRPVVRIDGRGDEPFRAAINADRLTAAFDLLAVAGRWRPRTGIGTFPIRFPHPDDPGDAGWHVEATGADAGGRPVTDPASPERVLLLLMLFSEVGPDDAPTRVRLGSHVDAARVLREAGRPADFFDLASRVEAATGDRPEALVTGEPGDVWLCHPFVLHAAQPHRGSRVRFMAQPPLPGTGPIDPSRADPSPVERAIA